MSFYDGKRAFITGGSSGIGKALAAALLRQGAHVVICGRRLEALRRTEEELRPCAAKPGQVVKAIQLDVADEKAVAEAAPAVLETLGGLDILINNAGNAHVGYIENEQNQNYRDMIDVNYLGSVWVTQAFLPHFMAQEGGHIGFTSSVLGQVPLFGYSAYCASKYAMTGYAECLRMDLMKYNIGVHICFPPDTDTPQHTEELKVMPAETKAVAGTIKMLSADDVARDFLYGIANGQLQIVPSLNNKLTMFAVRHLPGVSRFFMDRDIRNAGAPSRPGPPAERLDTLRRGSRPATAAGAPGSPPPGPQSGEG